MAGCSRQGESAAAQTAAASPAAGPRFTYNKPVIDLHFHWYPEEFIALMEKEAGQNGAKVGKNSAGLITVKTPTSLSEGGGSALRSDESKTKVDLMIKEMDEVGIDMEVLTQTNPHIVWAPPAVRR